MHAWPQVVSNRRGLKASLYKVSLLNIVFYKKIIVAAIRNSNAGTMIATYTISCWCTRKTAQNKQLTGYVCTLENM